MKKLFICLGLIIITASYTLAQVPQSFKYQAIARGADGNILSNQDISLRISIVLGNATRIAVYEETHKTRTSPFGLINLEIGNGKVESGDFSAIDWSEGKYFVNLEIDVNGGTDYVSMGSSQLLSVPYALYAEESGTSTSLSTGAKEADSWTEGIGVTYLTNPNNVGIGTTVPVSKLHITGTGINAVYERNISTAAGPANRFYKSRGSESSKTQIQAGDNMGQFQFWGMGDDGAYDIGATLKGVAESTRTGTDIFDVAASIQFLTTNTSFSWGERMRITADGYVGIGTTNPAGILDIAGAYHFPSVDGSNGQVLKTNGTGTLSWTTISGGSGAASINDLSDGKTGGSSVFLGTNAGYFDDGSENRNTGLGINALNSNTSGYHNTAVGFGALQSNNANTNTAIGYQALANNDVSGNTAIGYYTLWTNTGGADNVAVGNNALSDNNASSNTAVGFNAASGNTIGEENVAVGKMALEHNKTGSQNVAIGYKALGAFMNIGGTNTAIGCEALYNCYNTFNNTAVGRRAGYRNNGGEYNTLIGCDVNYYNQQGSNNTMIGFQAGRFTADHSKSGNVFIGYQAGYNETSDDKLYIDNSSSSYPLIYGEFDNNNLTFNAHADGNEGKVTINDILVLKSRTSQPTSPVEGELYVNSTDHHIYCYLNGSWVRLD